MKQYFFISCCVLIFSLGIFFRFYRYFDRWGLAYDQAHDVVVAREAINQFKIPLVGPFSSAGAFQTSGVWYWFIMAGILINSNYSITPWILLTILYCLCILGMIYVGSITFNRTFGLFLGLLTAISTAQIAQSVNLTNQSPLAITSFLLLLSSVLFLQTKKTYWLFLVGFFVALSGSIHLQGSSLIFVPISLLLISGIPSIKGITLLCIGFFIPTIPNLIFDLNNNFITIKGAISYITKDQYTISLDVLGRNWRMFVTDLMPQAWSHIIGGQKQIGLLLLFSFPTIVAADIVNRKINKIILFLLFSIGGMFFVLRYTRTPLFDSYFVFLHPFILFISAYVLYRLVKYTKIIGILLVLIILFSSFKKTLSEIHYGTNNAEKTGRIIRSFLELTYPHEKISLYDFQYNSVTNTMVAEMFLQQANKNSNHGRKIGFITNTNVASLSGKQLLIMDNFSLWDISSSSSSELLTQGWISLHSASVYTETQEWMK